MKKIIYTLIVLSCALSTMVLAKTVDCPSVELVAAHSHFNMAEPVIMDFWGLVDDTGYQFNNQKWVTGFAVKLPGVTSEADALHKGQMIFDSPRVVLNKPIVEQNVCMYARSSDFVVFATQADGNVLSHQLKTLI